MKKFYFLTLLIPILWACSGDAQEVDPGTGKGSITISAELAGKKIQSLGETRTPELTDLTVILTGPGSPKTMPWPAGGFIDDLEPGSYTVKVTTHPGGMPGAGFDNEYYEGSTTATVTSKGNETVTVTCPLLNGGVFFAYTGDAADMDIIPTVTDASAAKLTYPDKTTDVGYFAPTQNVTLTAKIGNLPALFNDEESVTLAITAGNLWKITFYDASATTGDINLNVTFEEFSIEQLSFEVTNPTPPGPVDTKKIAVTGGEASSEETANEDNSFPNSYDGNMVTMWHTKWNDSNVLPVTATYHLEEAQQLNTIIYYPRYSGNNGNFGEIEIWGSHRGSPDDFVKIMDYDCGKKSSYSRIDLAKPFLNPASIRFIIKTGQGNFASCAEMEFYQGDYIPTIEIPLGGNTFITAGTGGLVWDQGITYWNSSTTVFSSFFRVNNQKTLDIYLKCTPLGNDNTIFVTCNGDRKEITLTRPETGTETMIYLGKFEDLQPGYLRFDMQGGTLNSSNYANATHLVVEGADYSDLTYVGKPGSTISNYFGRRGPSIHLNYNLPSGNTEWVYSELTVPEGMDAPGSYYVANGFSVGYFGMQADNANSRRFLFSVWSPYETDNPGSVPQEDKVLVDRIGMGVGAEDFGNEGSGTKTTMTHKWIAGNTYKFLTRIRPVADNYTELTSYIYIPEISSWKLMAVLKRPKTQIYYASPHSFLENYQDKDGYITRGANYSNQWACSTDGVWTELTSATFTVDDTGRSGARMDYKGEANGSSFYMQNCGFFNEYTPYGSVFTRTATGQQPDIDFNSLP